MMNILTRYSAKNRRLINVRRNQVALDNYQMLKATLIDSSKLQNGTPVRYDASLSKVGRLYKLFITAKSGLDSIRFSQRDFTSVEEVDEYLRANTAFLLTDFKATQIPVIKYNPYVAIASKT